MKIPSDAAARLKLFKDVIEQCQRSQSERTETNAGLRNLYLFGSVSGERAKFNKINPHLQLVTAYIYAQETTKFSTRLGTQAAPFERMRLTAINSFVNDLWLDSNADAVVGDAVLWALVYNTMILKWVWIDGELRLFPLEPHLFGVYREDTNSLSNQEAVTQTTFITKAELARRLDGHPRLAEIMAKVGVQTGQPNEVADAGTTVSSIIMSAITPTLQGNVNTQDTRAPDYRPLVPEDLVRQDELWIWDDDLHDYRVVTIADPDVIIWDRANIFLPKELPFGKITPRPLYDYFWGESEAQLLRPLQELREKRFSELRELFALQLQPPKALVGFGGIQDEKAAALFKPRGTLISTMPGASAQEFKPEMPQDPFSELQQIDYMFDELSGTTPTLRGEGTSGVRSKNHAAKLADLSSSRLRRRALIIEDSLEHLATLALKVAQQEERDVKLADDQGEHFLISQFTSDFIVKVSAHTSSPIFAEQQAQMAAFLFEAHAIDRTTLIELLDPPLKEVMLERLKKIEAAEQQAQQAQLAAGAKPAHK